MKILVINAGSSSVKYQLLDMSNETVIASGLCERIGIDGHVKYVPKIDGLPSKDFDVSLPNHAEAISVILSLLMGEECGVIKDAAEIAAVGHRVVHGGEEFSSSVLITDDVMKTIEACVPLAPLHNPANLSGIAACKSVLGNLPHVAVFDTAFHQTMPDKSYIYAIPLKYYDQYKIRRYGFHGTSHKYVSQRAANLLGRPIEELKIITCHLGNGSSICAVEHGKSIDTSMGFTPVAGVPMGTRSGDIDGGIINFIMEKENINIEQMLDIMNKESGVLGISGVSSDFRDISGAAADGNERARLALEIFAYSVAKTVGSYAAAMNGVDAIVFTAGIGENDGSMRTRISEYLGYLGVEFDESANSASGERSISRPSSRVSLLVVPTNEELVIARDTKAIVESAAKI